VSKEHKAAISKDKMGGETKAALALMQDELKYMLTDHDKGLKEQMAEQSRKHAAKLAALKQLKMATQNLVTQKIMPPVHDYKVAAHFKSITKASEILFDGKPDNWPTFENHLIQEAGNPTI
jgi:hypothetical protein